MTTAPDDRTEVRRPEDTPTLELHAPADAFTPGTVLGGRYRIVSLLGRGGMGEVYRADDLRLNQPVALKFLSRQTKLDEIALHEEVRIGRQVSHPNVCRLYDIEEVDGRIFIAMEYVDGENLASLLRRVGRLAHDKALSVARDLCAGLAAAHEMGVIHRDLKPSNVLIDGRGRARVTDFGLAVEHDSSHASAGTPAYMAPEQLRGEHSTTQSDLYSLGLVLYEVFTGRRAIEGTSLGEIAKQQREQRFLRPSAIVDDVDPAVEQAILRCLDLEAVNRPASVHELVRELPGFDPVAAALAAGETPSAGLIAASAQKGDLSARMAWSLLGLAIAGLITAAAISPRAMVVSGASSKPPVVLLDRAGEVLSVAGVTRAPGDRGFSYQHKNNSRATPFEFLYRESPVAMRAGGLERRLTDSQPPFMFEHMSLVRLDPMGRLIELAVIPPRRDTAPPSAPYDWSKLIAMTGIDAAQLRPARSEWSARSDSDFKRAWIAGDKRIEAASYRGRPVWFAVVEPEGPARRRTDFAIAQSIEMALVIILPAAVLLIAWRNYRRGSSDRRGALRLTAFLIALLFVTALLRMHHPSSIRSEWIQVSTATAETTFIALVIGIAYVAIEPLVRRRWPEVLIAWSRLLGGRWRDPMIGRDILAGAVLGVAIGLAFRMTAIAPQWFGIDASPLRDSAEALSSLRHTGAVMLLGLIEAIYKSIFALVLVLLMRAIVRRVDFAVALSALIVTAFYLAQGSGPLEVRVAYGLFVAGVIYVVLFRLGLLALMATGFVASVLFRIPMTLDTTSWYFPRTLLVLLVLGALFCFGFYTSLDRKRFLPRLAI